MNPGPAKSAYTTIRYEIAGPVLTITLTRPDRLNTLNRTMFDELNDALDRSDADPEIRAVVFTGEGRAFCGGFEMHTGNAFDVGFEETGMGELAPDHPIRDMGGLLSLRLYESLKPIIAAVNGPAVGVGATMLLPMDIRLAADNARFGFVFSRRGIVPEAASGWFLPRVVGISNALDWTLTGRLVPAVEAERAGLLKSVHSAGELLPAALAIARDISTQAAPVSATLVRHMMWRGLTLDQPMEAHRIDSRLMASRGSHKDAQEGVSAFLEKRTPTFPGRVPHDLPASWPWWRERPFS